MKLVAISVSVLVAALLMWWGKGDASDPRRDTAPATIERAEYDFEAVQIIMSYRNQPARIERATDAFRAEEWQGVLALRDLYGPNTPVIAARQLPDINACVGAFQADARMDSQDCHEHYTATPIITDIGYTHKRRVPPRHFLALYPRQSIPQIIQNEIGTPTNFCGKNIKRNAPLPVLHCEYAPTTGKTMLGMRPWKASKFERYYRLPPNKSVLLSPTTPRPFATGVDRAYEQIFTRLYSPPEDARPSSQFMPVPGRLLWALKACDDHTGWSRRAKLSNAARRVDLTRHLIVVTEHMPSDFGDEAVHHIVPNMPIVMVSLMPLNDGAHTNTTDPIESCVVDARNGRVFESTGPQHP